MFDGMRVICLVWILTFGTAQFTMGGTAYNPWTLRDYFMTSAYTLVIAANLGFEQFFLFSSFFAYVKIALYYQNRKED